MAPTPEDAEEAARRLIDYIQQYKTKRPAIIHGIDDVTRALLVQEGRDFVAARLEEMTPEDVSTMVALATHLTKARPAPREREKP